MLRLHTTRARLATTALALALVLASAAAVLLAPTAPQAGAAETMPSKSSGKRCASFMAWRPPAEHPTQYEYRRSSS